MIRYPNGKTAITPNRDTTAYLPQGSTVYNGAQTHAMLSNNPQFSRGTLPRFHSGTNKKKHWYNNVADSVTKGVADFGKGAGQKFHGIKNKTGEFLEGAKNVVGKGAKWLGNKVGDVMDWVSKPGKLLDKVLEAFGVNMEGFGIPKAASLPFDMMKGMFGKLKSAATDLFKNWLEDVQGREGDASWLFKHPIWQKFGNYTGGLNFNGGKHYGMDFGMPIGTNVKAVAGGKVSNVWTDYGGGKSVEVQLGKNMWNWYMHLSKQLVKKGQKVNAGDLIGKSGDTGNFVRGAHLHFQLMKGDHPGNDTAVNPMSWLKNLEGGSQSKAASKWAPDIKRAAKQMKVNLSNRELKGIIAQIQRESNGNAGVTQGNIGDINNLRGTPAQGLLQYVPSTFKSYAVKGHKNIKNGYDQLLAFFNNSNWRRDLPYVKSGWGPSGSRRFATGTNNAPRGLAQVFEEGGEIMNLRGGETIIPNDVSIQAFKQIASSDIFNRTQSAVYEGISRYADALREKQQQATREQLELQRLSNENTTIQEQNDILKEMFYTMQQQLQALLNIQNSTSRTANNPTNLDGKAITKTVNKHQGKDIISALYNNGGVFN
ncbi:peptidoglycan DD-metalloendopeptidase family protein [Staphylococcus gallinarum]|uniref:peptidoglycan DD-metalloendopeptidase family protein n=1 Tax=Staphylococcus gallinarum TaxID=1293 RepID=UPI001E2F776F|nr:peptidoglycan DD-metalloendopeptidase family protein [Staphylococcus gallinarum]MCD8843574.1 peptidoglycan DD-metalloendopeptidase family protein [Staphylococcus gallinarum]